MLTDILLLIFVLATAVQLLFWLGIFSKFAFYAAPEKPEKPEKPVSVVLCARNEAENLQKNLYRIVNQTGRSPEVIVVNDNSTDATLDTLLHYQVTFPYLRIINYFNKPAGGGKKWALAEGIRAASHETILVTDADCYPQSDRWVQKMQAALGDEKAIVLGYAPYEKQAGFLNKFIRYETIYTATQYFSFALCKMPYMGVGRNLLYKKQLFEKAGGFDRHLGVISGDDDLFVNQVATADNVAITIDPDTFVYSRPKNTWENYHRQKARHLTASKHYKRRDQLVLGMLSMSHLLHYWVGAALLILKISTIFVAVLFGIRFIVLLWLFGQILNKLHDRSLWFSIPLLDAAYSLYYIIFSPALLINKRKWS